MKRRGFLAALGVGGVTSVAGCTGDGSSGTASSTDAVQAPYEHPGTLDTTFVTNGDYPADDDPGDGYPPAFENPPAPTEADESEFRAISANGMSVRLVPIDVARNWYDRGEARFVDARGLPQYERAHVYGAVLSTAQKGSEGGGIDGWSTEKRVVTYCGCPHHLSSIRAAGLKKAGYAKVYALDEGFGEWSERGYPMAGTAFGTESQGDLSEWTIEGSVPARFAGEYAWASAGRQYEAAPIGADGAFTLRVKFAGVSGDTPVRVSTPAFTVTRPLSTLVDGVVSG